LLAPRRRLLLTQPAVFDIYPPVDTTLSASRNLPKADNREKEFSMRVLATAALVFGLLAGPSAMARADSITVGGGWQTFSWTSAPGSFNAEGTLSFTTSQTAKLTVTDAFLDGDRFQVFDGAKSLGLTSVPADDGTQVSGDPDAARANPKFSSAVFALTAGSHAITIKTVGIAAGHPSGTAFLRVDSDSGGQPPSGGPGGTPGDSPEPATCTLLVAAGVCLAGYGWRRQRRKPALSAAA
jgi:hypothetical protein